MDAIAAPAPAADWTAVGADVTSVIATAIAPTLQKAGEEIYERLLYGVQDYLVENVLFNIGSRIEAANAQAFHDRQRAISAETKVEALLNGCNALLGLLTLLRNRDDLSAEVRAALTEGHRIDEAKAAVARALGGVG